MEGVKLLLVFIIALLIGQSISIGLGLLVERHAEVPIPVSSPSSFAISRCSGWPGVLRSASPNRVPASAAGRAAPKATKRLQSPGPLKGVASVVALALAGTSSLAETARPTSAIKRRTVPGSGASASRRGCDRHHSCIRRHAVSYRRLKKPQRRWPNCASARPGQEQIDPGDDVRSAKYANVQGISAQRRSLSQAREQDQRGLRQDGVD